MLQQFLMTGALLATVSLSAYADDKHQPLLAAASNAGFEKMKTLVGTWVKADENGKPTEDVVSVIKLTAGGSAIQETLFPGQPLEMISMYTVDGNDLIMTHYCVIGNQPRMRATAKTVGKELKFEFDGGANLDPKKDKHMHSATLKFADDDHIEIDGTGWENGAPAEGSCGCLKLVRKK
jgi:hypothetical protein